MINFKKKNISKNLRDNLATLQATINAQHSYSEQVEAAQTLWESQQKAVVNAKTHTRNFLQQMNLNGHCFYCENGNATDIEHYYPKSFYPESTFDWDNYLLACPVCNRSFKGAKFALWVNQQRYDLVRNQTTGIVPPPIGDPLLLNPRRDNPQDFLSIDLLKTFTIQPRSALSPYNQMRAQYTIEVLGLNLHAELPRWRRREFGNFVGWVDKYDRIKREKKINPLKEHKRLLSTHSHRAVWLEMQRFYREQHTRPDWLALKKYRNVAEIDRIFTQHPELLDLNFD